MDLSVIRQKFSDMSVQELARIIADMENARTRVVSTPRRLREIVGKKRRTPSDAERAAYITAKGQIKAAKILVRGAIIAAIIGLLATAIANADKFYTPAASSSATSARYDGVSLWSRSVGGLVSGLSCLLLMLWLLSSAERGNRKEGENFLAA